MANTKRANIIRKVIVSAACFFVFAVALWTAWDFAEPRIAERFPLFSWRHGTPRMQSIAVKELMKQIKPGMTYEQVLNILGPGSLDWPKQKERKLTPKDTVSFNVRSWYNNGVDVGFRDGRVVSTFYYD